VVHDQGVSPGLGNPNKLANLRPGLGAEGRRKHVRSIANKLRRYLESHKKTARDSQGRTTRSRLARESAWDGMGALLAEYQEGTSLPRGSNPQTLRPVHGQVERLTVV